MKRKKRSITLIEMIVVMLLIAIITGAIAYNYRESLNQGKVFKTKEAISRIETILDIYLAEQPGHGDDIAAGWRSIVQQSPLVKNPDDFMQDAWGGDFHASYEVNAKGENVFRVHSEKYDAYLKSKK